MGLEIQMICLVLAPSFLAAGVYVTIKHIVLHRGSKASLIRPNWYPWIFISCDIGSIIVQAIGGTIAALSASQQERRQPNMTLMNIGDDLMIAGIAFQIFTMASCGILVLGYYRRSRLLQGGKSRSTEVGVSDGRHTEFHLFCFGIATAYLTILTRCTYRVIEMAGGLGNWRMREEPPFLVLDGMMTAFASLALTLAHPAVFLPAEYFDEKGKTRILCEI